VLLGGVETVALGDEFDRLEGSVFFEIPGRSDVRKAKGLSFAEIEGLPAALRGERSALVIVKTDQGNLGKILISCGLRRQNPSGDRDSTAPVLILDRYATLDSRDRKSFKARGRDVSLFEGFWFDLDTGQVVPEGFGGDIHFAGQGKDGPRLSPAGSSGLFTLTKPVALPARNRPASGRIIEPSDFAGHYYLVADGQWTGKLELAIAQDATVSGTFRSDRVGTAYPVTGKVAADVPGKISFVVRFPRGTQQFYEGMLWSEGKNTIAGTVSMLEHPYGFVAVREGSSLVPEELDVSPPPKLAGATARLVVTLETSSKSLRVDGRPASLAELAELLAKKLHTDSATAVLLRSPGTIQFDRIQEVVAAIRSAGVTIIQLAGTNGKGDPQ
jgi:biopolymer transport protein ExbD